MKTTLIVTTYNWPEALGVTLDSIKRQTYRDLELVVADDGSTSGTAETVQKYLADSHLSWLHVRHHDQGIRQSRIKNLAVRYSTGDYLIFIDHDVPLHPHFIEDHLTQAAPDCFLQGKRVFLSPAHTRQLIDKGTFDLVRPWAKGLENRKNAFWIPQLTKLLARKKRFQTTIRGCNISMDRRTFMAVDGFDEIYDGLWGREDSDLCYRMFHSGFSIKNLWFAALQYHLQHATLKQQGWYRLDDELAYCRRQHRKIAVQGFSALSPEGAIVAASRQTV